MNLSAFYYWSMHCFMYDIELQIVYGIESIFFCCWTSFLSFLCLVCFCITILSIQFCLIVVTVIVVLLIWFCHIWYCHIWFGNNSPLASKLFMHILYWSLLVRSRRSMSGSIDVELHLYRSSSLLWCNYFLEKVTLRSLMIE